jgi:hypothetical protein
MSIEKYIPIFAPMPPAVVIGLQLYDEVMHAAHDPAWWWLASIAAAFGVVGTIGAEMFAYKYALQAWAEREKGAALVAAALGLVVSGLIIWTVWRTDDSRPLVVAVLVAIAAYIVSAIKDFVEAKRANREEQTDRQVRLMDEQRKLTNAQARLAKAGGNVQSLSTGQNGQNGQTAKITEKTEKVKRIEQYWKANPTASLRDCAAACECSPETARKWKP